jgi:hypothetical protein
MNRLFGKNAPLRIPLFNGILVALFENVSTQNETFTVFYFTEKGTLFCVSTCVEAVSSGFYSKNKL